MPYITLGTSSQLQIQVPTKGTTGWSETLRTNTFLKIAEHDHTGGGKGEQLSTGAIADDSITGAKIRLSNNENLTARNAANSADLNLLKADANDELVFGITIATAEFQDDGLTVVDNADNTKVLALQLSGITTGTTRTLNSPDASGTIVLEDNTATITNKTMTSAGNTLTIDADVSTVSNIKNAEIKAGAAIAVNKLASVTADRVLISDGSGFLSASSVSSTTLGYLDATSSIQTQLNTKTDTGTAIGLADNAIMPGTGSMTIPKGTTAQRSGTPASGMLRFNTSSNEFEGYDGSSWGEIGGSAGGGLTNYITNPGAETDTTGWSTFDDAGSFVDGTGGTASNLTFSRNTSSPLRDNADFDLVVSAADASGEGVSFDFSTENADKYSILRVSFDYSTDAPDDFFAIGIYDVTNGAIINPVKTDLKANSNNTKFITEFQTTNSTSYRLALYVKDTDATGYTINFDNVEVGPREIAKGPVVTDLVSFTPTGSWSTNTSYSGFYRRIGDSMECEITVTTSGAPNSANLTVNLPSGFTIDTSKLDASSTTNGSLGLGGAYDNSGTLFPLRLQYESTTAVRVYAVRTDGTYADLSPDSTVDQAIPFTWGSGDRLTVKFTVPISGWGGSGAISSDFGNRLIYSEGRGNGGTSLTGGTTNIDFTETIDKTSSFDGTTFTAPETGVYNIEGCVFLTSTVTGNMYSYINGTINKLMGTASAADDIYPFSGLLELNKGDALTFRFSANATLSNNTNVHHVAISKVQTPQTLQGRTVIGMKATNNAGTSLTATTTNMDFSNTVYDTHNAWDGDEFTAPESGKYSIKGIAQFTSGFNDYIGVYINGTLDTAMNVGLGSSTSPFFGEVDVNQGDVITVRTISGSYTLSNNSTQHWLAIHKIN